MFRSSLGLCGVYESGTEIWFVLLNLLIDLMLKKEMHLIFCNYLDFITKLYRAGTKFYTNLDVFTRI